VLYQFLLVLSWFILLDQTELTKYETMRIIYNQCMTASFPTLYRNSQRNFSMKYYIIIHVRYLLTHLITYLLSPWCSLLLLQLTGLQLIKIYPAFHGTRRFITTLTSVRQLSLSWISPIQSIKLHSISWRSILILFTHLCLSLPSGLFPADFATKTLYTPSPHPYAPHNQPISFFSILSIAQYCVRC